MTRCEKCGAYQFNKKYCPQCGGHMSQPELFRQERFFNRRQLYKRRHAE